MATTSTPRPRPLALSPSRASDYQQCPLLYRFRAIDKIPEPKTIAQVKGTLVHAVLEETHKLPREERTYPAAVKMIKPSWADMTAKDAELLDLAMRHRGFANGRLLHGGDVVAEILQGRTHRSMLPSRRIFFCSCRMP